ncbi:MAG: SUMF1/EgtB/PvdO family nonheme iron enzyme [Desulfovibrionaceae bacterium]
MLKCRERWTRAATWPTPDDMVRICCLTVFAVMLLLFMALPCRAHNPKPASGDLVLPMPGGGEMAFRPVFLGQGDGPFALRKFKMGDPDGGFREYPTSVVLGGAFIVSDKGRRDWCYYLGKYEVTEGQYYAVMGLPQGAEQSMLQSTAPVTGVTYFDALVFADRYNRWLLENASAKLPSNGSMPGFVRLPTEVEWEYAARGGAKVTPDQFDRKLPYDGLLPGYEWFSGPTSSHNKLKKSGILNPNVLGLHDMLGNASEMTQSLYRIEYYQGRPGGFVSRGGHFLTAENTMRSSLRTEEPFYIGSREKGFKPNAKPTMGFRLTLSSIVYPDRAALKDMESAWDAYRGGKGADLPAAVSVSPTSVQSDVKSREAFDHLARVKAELARLGASENVTRELGFIEAALNDMRFIRRQADEDSAYAWAKIASEQGFFIYRELMKLPTVETLLESAQTSGRTAMIEKLAQRRDEIAGNIDAALGTYSDSFRQLAATPDEAVGKAFERYVNFLLERGAADQVRVLKTVQLQYREFGKTKRADAEGWRKQFQALGAQ